MAAALRKLLVLKLGGGGPGPLQHPHDALDVEGVAEAGVGVDDDRHVDGVHDVLDLVQHLLEGRQPEVRRGQQRVSDAGPGHIDRLEAGQLGLARRQGAVDARARARRCAPLQAF